ncbi:MAG: hypothetical protein ACUVQS_02915 [Candidatus Bipolaricaulaceae bacterium]
MDRVNAHKLIFHKLPKAQEEFFRLHPLQEEAKPKAKTPRSISTMRSFGAFGN